MSADTPKLHNWSVHVELKPSGNRYLAPEAADRRVYVRGDVHGHPFRPDGECIYTSRIIDAKGRTVTTRSGSRYHLGRPSRAYLTWLRESGREYDPRQPFSMLETPDAE